MPRGRINSEEKAQMHDQSNLSHPHAFFPGRLSAAFSLEDITLEFIQEKYT
jgi:hypothetical protein